MIRGLLSLIAMLALPAAAQDYGREKRWADEVVPGIVVGDAVSLKTSAGREFLAIYTPAKTQETALVIVHGVGVHPDHGVIGVLRVKLADMGFTTLSIQMPVQGAQARVEDYYPRVFPEAAERMAVAGEWLRARGHARLVLVTHSMGSWMANEYLDATASSPYAAWVCMGLTGGYSWGTYFAARPILDVYGGEDLDSVLAAAWRRRMTLATAHPASLQVMIPGADHFYTGKEGALAEAIRRWLREALR